MENKHTCYSPSVKNNVWQQLCWALHHRTLHKEMVPQTLVKHGWVSVCSHTHTLLKQTFLRLLTAVKSASRMKRVNIPTHSKTAPTAWLPHTGAGSRVTTYRVRTPRCLYIRLPPKHLDGLPDAHSTPQLVTWLALGRGRSGQRETKGAWCTGYTRNLTW